MPPWFGTCGKRRLEQTTSTSTNNGKELRRYAAHVHQLLHRGASTVEDILTFLNLVNDKTNAELVLPCSSSGARLCHILDHLGVYNEVLQFIDGQLMEVNPGEFGFFALDGYRNGGKGSSLNGWILLHWLLRKHPCIKTLTLTRSLNNRYHRLLSEALQLNSGLNKLTFLCWNNIGGFLTITSAIGTLAQLKELNMNHVSLYPSVLDELGKALSEISTLQTLTLPSFRTNRHDCVARFVRALKGCLKLSVLSCEDYVLKPQLGDAFAELVAQSVSLRKLFVRYLVCRRDEVHALFTALSLNHNIEELHLQGFVLREAAEKLLAKVLAQHTGIRHLEVVLQGADRKEGKNNGAALASMVGSNKVLRELVFVGGNASRLSAFAEAVRKNNTMEKLTLGLVDMDVSDYRVFMQALACNQALQLVKFEEYEYKHSDDITLLAQETGTEGRLVVNADICNPQQFESVLKNSTRLSRVAYRASKTTSPLSPGALCHLLQHHHLQELFICLNYLIETESATSLGLFLSTTKNLRSVHLNFPTSAASSQILVEGLAGNTSLTSLTIAFWTFDTPEAHLFWHMLGSSRTLKTLSLVLLNFTKTQVLRTVPDGLLKNHYLLEADIQRNPSMCRVPANIEVRGTLEQQISKVSTDTFQFGIKELTRRNLSTLHRAVQFVMGSRGRRFAEAFERVSKGLTLVEALRKAIGGSEEEIKGKIASSTRYLNEHFLAAAGVVKHAVVCGGSSGVQLDGIGIDVWIHIRQYLKVTDIVLEHEGLQVESSSPKKRC